MKAYKFNFKFDEPVSIAWKTFFYNTSDLLILEDGLHEGLGEASPNEVITHDTQEDVFDYFKKIDINTKELDEDKVHNQIDYLPKGSPSARAAVDFALHDLWGKQREKPVHKLYSNRVNNVKNSITVFGKDVEGTKKDVLETLKRFPHLEVIKLKLMGKDDIKRCVAAKESVESQGRKVSYLLDCNQGYKTKDDAVNTINKIHEVLEDIILIEEPVPAKEWDLLRSVTRNVDVPIYADESCVDMTDVDTIIGKGCADGINIKLQKTGGIWSAKKIAERCDENGLKVMVGCMFETAIGISAGINFASSTKNVSVTDLDFDLALPDIYKFRPGFDNGVRSPIDKPGLGVGLDHDKIKRLKESSVLIHEQVI